MRYCVLVFRVLTALPLKFRQDIGRVGGLNGGREKGFGGVIGGFGGQMSGFGGAVEIYMDKRDGLGRQLTMVVMSGGKGGSVAGFSRFWSSRRRALAGGLASDVGYS